MSKKNIEMDNFDNYPTKYIVHDMPELPDFTKRPKILPSNSLDSNNRNRNNDNNITYNFYNVQNSSLHGKNASVSFFSDDVNDEETFNELPLNEILDDFDYNSADNNNSILDTSDNELEEEEVDDDDETNNKSNSFLMSREQTPDPIYQSLGKEINRSSSPFLKTLKPVYTTDIPSFYDSSTLNYHNKSPLDYTDEEFDKMNHFEFLKDLNFELPPLLPVYLNSNLLNDSNSKNYKTFPYQFQESTVPHVNEIYKYRINDLHLMDKYSTQKFSRPLLKRASSSNSSTTSSYLMKTNNINNNNSNNRNSSSKLKHRLMRENSNNSNNSFKSNTKLKHLDKMYLIERNLIPHHVMLNHLITCNFNKDGYITSSCITRYKGKFITQIMFFSNEPDQFH